MAGSADWRTEAAAALGGGAGAGAALGLADAALLLARGLGVGRAADGAGEALRLLAADGAAEAVRLLAAGGVAGAAAGALAGLAVAPLAVPLRRALATRPRLARALPAGLAAAAAAAFAADALLYVRLYAPAHLLAGLAALAAAALAGALVLPGRAGPPVAAAAALVAALAAFAGPALLGPTQRVWRGVLDGATLLARVARLWPMPEAAAAAASCDWPPAAPRAAAPGAPALAPGAPVVLFTIDALRGDLGGARLAETLPRLAAHLDGAYRFDGAHAAVTRTNESVYALLTGRWPHRLDFRAAGVDDFDHFHVLDPGDPRLLDPTTWKQRHPLPVTDRTPTLPGLLRAAGWRTLTAIPYVFFLPKGGITREFDTVDDAAYQTRNRDNMGVTSDVLALRARALVDAVPPGARWLLWVHWMDPHAPYVEYGTVAADAPDRARYLAELHRVDDAAGALLDGLRAAGRLDGAVLAVTGDHGEEFGDHGGRYHGTTVYEEQAWVPLFVRVPGRRAAAPIATTVSLVDLTPTLLDLVGAAGGTPFDGRSLVPAMDGLALAPRPILAMATMEGRRAAVYDGALKLIEGAGGGPVELYDLTADPLERANLADLRPDDVARLRCLVAASGVLAPAPAPVLTPAPAPAP